MGPRTASAEQRRCAVPVFVGTARSFNGAADSVRGATRGQPNHQPEQTQTFNGAADSVRGATRVSSSAIFCHSFNLQWGRGQRPRSNEGTTGYNVRKLDLQWGRGQRPRSNLRRVSGVTGGVLLQWGRGQRPRSNLRTICCRWGWPPFNGAADSVRGATRYGQSALATIRPSMGPRTASAEQLLKHVQVSLDPELLQWGRGQRPRSNAYQSVKEFELSKPSMGPRTASAEQPRRSTGCTTKAALQWGRGQRPRSNPSSLCLDTARALRLFPRTSSWEGGHTINSTPPLYLALLEKSRFIAGFRRSANPPGFTHHSGFAQLTCPCRAKPHIPSAYAVHIHSIRHRQFDVGMVDPLDQ